MAAGTGPGTDRARALAERWNVLVNRFTNGDPEVERMLYEAGDKFRANTQAQGAHVPDVLGYVRQVFASRND